VQAKDINMDYDIHSHNGHGSVPSELENCPLCGQLLPNGAEAARIQAKLDADERARQRQQEADRLAARSEGIAAAQPQIAALNEKIITLGETMDAAINERVDRERLAVEARVSGELTVKNAEIVKLTKKISELSRAAEGRPPQQLGQMTEVQAFNALKAAAAFSSDNITRVPPGKPGADITVEFRHNGKSACTAIIEVKNETGFGWSWPAKLRQNKQDAGADFAVLVTAAFPSKLPPMPMVHEGVLLCPPGNLVEFMEIVRGAGIKLHLAKAAGRNINGAGEKILDFCAGKGRDVLQSLGRRGERQKALNQELLKDVNKHIRASDKLADGQANDVRDFTTAVDGIISGDDDGEDIS
jgi:hypothetical protein